MRTVADQFAETLAAAGVKRIYGIVGDSLNGLTDAIRRQDQIEWVHVRHEEVAAFAAGAEAHLTGELAVCAGSCGPGNLHLINGLYDAQRSGVGPASTGITAGNVGRLKRRQVRLDGTVDSSAIEVHAVNFYTDEVGNPEFTLLVK